MKKKLFSISMQVAVVACCALILSSCHKDHHTYLSTITYDNNTYTPLSLTVNGATTTIQPLSSASFSGTPGAGANVTAQTAGTYGDVINWNFTDVFPANGTVLEEPFDVSHDYFYLEITNVDATSRIVGLQVNTQASGSAYSNENVNIPNDGNTYGLGYYPAYNNTAIEVDFTSGPSLVYSGLYIPNVDDASYVLTVH